ncbi:hypothetical protein ACH4FE_00290 [Streptomyces celluloflavus]|uniref:hypothetical protein n=1 Tax=Streptomyces celluloflavus TaxID=58344 RepID=UPI00379E5552
MINFRRFGDFDMDNSMRPSDAVILMRSPRCHYFHAALFERSAHQEIPNGTEIRPPSAAHHRSGGPPPAPRRHHAMSGMNAMNCTNAGPHTIG